LGERDAGCLPHLRSSVRKGEQRAIEIKDGRFHDKVTGYAVHLYRIGGAP
jgi:hypothetical protein